MEEKKKEGHGASGAGDKEWWGASLSRVGAQYHRAWNFTSCPRLQCRGINMPGAKCELSGSSPGGEPVTTSSLLEKEAQSAPVRGLGGA